MGNQLKTALLLGVLTVMIVWCGAMLGGAGGMITAFVFATGMNFFSYWFSDRLVLKMYRAREATESDAPELYGAVRKISSAAGLPMPRVYILPSESPNAFATGRNPRHAAVAVTAGIMRILNRQELEGVLAHEMAHINNRDILIGTIAAVLAGAITLLAGMARWGAILGGFGRDDDEGGSGLEILVLAFVAPLAAMIIQLAISRSREYLADATGARFAGSPAGLARALAKLEQAAQRTPLQSSPSTAHMFIVKPFSRSSMMQLFSTHPPIEERIRRLQSDAAQD